MRRIAAWLLQPNDVFMYHGTSFTAIDVTSSGRRIQVELENGNSLDLPQGESLLLISDALER